MPSGRIGVDDGLALIRQRIRAGATETIGIGETLGRVTAAPVVARRTVPGFRAAAMDGYAVRSADVASATPGAPVVLPIAGWVPAGSWPPALPVAEAFGIGTGAPLPEMADSIVMIEHAERLERSAAFTAPAAAGRNVREIGEDVWEGETVIRAGVLITPDMIAGLSAYGVSDIDVVRIPKLAVIVTGSELGAQVADSNGPMVAAYAQSIGVDVRAFGPVADTEHAIDAALDAACSSAAGLILTTGGASSGSHDLVRAALERRNAEIVFHGLSMRPGKPILFAMLADGRPFFGLPGNPVSACIGMRFFVSEALRRMLGLPTESGLPVESEEPGREGTTLFLRGRLDRSVSPPRIDTDLDQRSHILSSLMAADCWLRIDRDGARKRHLAFPKRLSLDERI